MSKVPNYQPITLTPSPIPVPFRPTYEGAYYYISRTQLPNTVFFLKKKFLFLFFFLILDPELCVIYCIIRSFFVHDFISPKPRSNYCQMRKPSISRTPKCIPLPRPLPLLRRNTTQVNLSTAELQLSGASARPRSDLEMLLRSSSVVSVRRVASIRHATMPMSPASPTPSAISARASSSRMVSGLALESSSAPSS